jgi:hypothetical protein
MLKNRRSSFKIAIEKKLFPCEIVIVSLLLTFESTICKKYVAMPFIFYEVERQAN